MYTRVFPHPFKISEIFLFPKLSKYTHPDKLVCDEMRPGSLPIIEDILPTSQRLPKEAVTVL